MLYTAFSFIHDYYLIFLVDLDKRNESMNNFFKHYQNIRILERVGTFRVWIKLLFFGAPLAFWNIKEFNQRFNWSITNFKRFHRYFREFDKNTRIIKICLVLSGYWVAGRSDSPSHILSSIRGVEITIHLRFFLPVNFAISILMRPDLPPFTVNFPCDGQ